jgi:cytoskeletal protein CcmA (bactofilin family)|tara:strand:- start:61 stop:684 length:624 start_codon:yes stop_codon:yes gene_type:complete
MSTTKYKQDLDVTGNITLSGNVTADGNIILGDADTDSITLNADITSNIVPDVTNTYDLGTTGKNWKDLFISNNITVGNNVVALQVATLNNLTVGADLAVTANANITGNLNVTGDITGNVTANTATVVNLIATNITATGSGTQTISAGANIELDATNRVLVTDTPFRLASFTTVERDAIASPVNGDMIYNTTDNKIQSYANSAWVDLH